MPSTSAVLELEAIPGKPVFVPAARSILPGQGRNVLRTVGMAGEMHVHLKELREARGEQSCRILAAGVSAR